MDGATFSEVIQDALEPTEFETAPLIKKPRLLRADFQEAQAWLSVF